MDPKKDWLLAKDFYLVFRAKNKNTTIVVEDSNNIVYREKEREHYLIVSRERERRVHGES